MVFALCKPQVCIHVLICMHCVGLQNEEYYNKLPEPTEDELDMLDLAFGLTDT